MKSIYQLLGIILFFTCLSANTFAQADSLYYDIKEESKEMSEGEHSALVIYIPKADANQAKDVWREFMDQYDGNTKKGWFSSEFHTKEAHIYSVGGVDPVDVYAEFNETDGGINGIIWFRLTESDFLNSTTHENAFIEAKRIVDNFGVTLRKRVLKNQMEEEAEKLDDLQDEMEDLKDEKKDLEETIADAKKRIKEAEENLKKNAENQENMQEKLKGQQRKVEEAKRRFNSTNE